MKLKYLVKNCRRLYLSSAVFLCAVFVFSCTVARIDRSAPYKLDYLDEYILEDQMQFEGDVIGGLSGIDFDGEKFVLITDHSRNSKIFTVDFSIKNKKIEDVEFIDSKTLSCDSVSSIDSESIRILEDGYLVVGEGNVKRNHNPVILKVDNKGNCIKSYGLPQYYQADFKKGPRNNRVFESLSLDSDQSGFWITSELPLKIDGKPPMLIDNNSPLRLTYYNFNDSNPDSQLAYDLDRIIKLPLLPFAVNGATEILQIDENYLLVLERTFSAGHKSKGNRIKIFLVEIKDKTNLLGVSTLKKSKVHNLKKHLLFDSKPIIKQLQNKFVDNIEGMTIGPRLKSGNKSLILVSDNNFNILGTQINQFLLLELIKN